MLDRLDLCRVAADRRARQVDQKEGVGLGELEGDEAVEVLLGERLRNARSSWGS